MSTSMNTLLEILDRLEQGQIHYTLSRYLPRAVSIRVSVPGSRWEIDVHEDDSVEVEVFRSDGRILDRSALDELIREHSD